MHRVVSASCACARDALSNVLSNAGLVSSLSDVRVKQVALGKAHIVVLSADGRIWTAGVNSKGQCGRQEGVVSIAQRIAEVEQERDGQQKFLLVWLSALFDSVHHSSLQLYWIMFVKVYIGSRSWKFILGRVRHSSYWVMFVTVHLNLYLRTHTCFYRVVTGCSRSNSQVFVLIANRS